MNKGAFQASTTIAFTGARVSYFHRCGNGSLVAIGPLFVNALTTIREVSLLKLLQQELKAFESFALIGNLNGESDNSVLSVHTPDPSFGE